MSSRPRGAQSSPNQRPKKNEKKKRIEIDVVVWSRVPHRHRKNKQTNKQTNKKQSAHQRFRPPELDGSMEISSVRRLDAEELVSSSLVVGGQRKATPERERPRFEWLIIGLDSVAVLRVVVATASGPGPLPPFPTTFSAFPNENKQKKRR